MPEKKNWNPHLAWLLLAALWLLLFFQIKTDWDVIPNYSYGWAVPFLGLYLFWNRWETRPNPSSTRFRKPLMVLAGLLFLSIFPIRLIQEANTDWRLVHWCLAVQVCVISFIGIYLFGGLAWVRHFSFPLLFPLVAVPWPSGLEKPLIQDMMSTVSVLVVEILNWIGIPAVNRGNVIELATGSVGMDEACSGIQSFQASMMVALFLGELFLFTPLKRLSILAFSAILAFTLNVGRAFFLSYRTSIEGMGAIDRWHDSVGMYVMVGCFAGIIAAAFLLNWKNSPPKRVDPSTLQPATYFSSLWAILGLVGILVMEVLTEGWYRIHETSLQTKPSWTLHWSTERPEYHERQFTGRERTFLRFSEGKNGSWKEPDGTHFSIYFLRWYVGNAGSRHIPDHSPEICLFYSGSTMQKNHGYQTFRYEDFEIPMRAFTFQNEATQFHIFYAHWEDRVNSTSEEDENPFMHWSRSARLYNVLLGKRQSSQQIIEIAIFDQPDFDKAFDLVKTRLAEMIQTQ